jgi:hypothetical protein
MTEYTFRILEVYNELGTLKRKLFYSSNDVSHDLKYCLQRYEEIIYENKNPGVRFVLEIDDIQQPALKRRFKTTYERNGIHERSMRLLRVKNKIQADIRRIQEKEQSIHYENPKYRCPKCGKYDLTESGLHMHLRMRHELNWNEINMVRSKSYTANNLETV